MKRFIKMFAVVLSVTLVAGMFVGCGNKEKSDVTKDGKTIITWWSGDTHMQKVIDEVVAEFNQTIGEENDVELRVEFKEGSLTQNLEIAIQTGEAPDFMGGGSMAQLAESGNLLSVDELPGAEEILKVYEGSSAMIDEYNIYNGSTYRLPLSATTQGLIYNKDMFKAAGIVDENGEPTPPKTFKEMRDYAKRLTNPSKNQYGLVVPLKWTSVFPSEISYPAARSQGFVTYNPATGKYDFDNVAKVAQYYVDMKNDGSILPGAEGLDNDPARAKFAEGNIGMKMAFSFDVGVLNDQFPAKCDWGVAPYPLLDENEEYASPFSVSYTPLMNGASKDKADKMAVVLKWMISDEYISRLYKEGVSLPWNWDIVKDVKLGSDTKKGWKEFAQLVSLSKAVPVSLVYYYEEVTKPQDAFINDIWTNGKDCKQVFDKVEKEINASVDKYYKENPEHAQKHKSRIIPDYSGKID